MRQPANCHIYLGKFVETDKGGVSLWLAILRSSQAKGGVSLWLAIRGSSQAGRLRHFTFDAITLPVPRRYAMAPPHLPADAPVLDVFQPLRVNLFPMLRKEPDQVIAHDRERLFRLRVTQEPLLAETWFN